MARWNILHEAYLFSVGISVALFISLALAIWLAWRSGPPHMVIWRWVKFVSAGLSIVSITLLLVAYDQFVRSTIVDLQGEEKKLMPIKLQFALTGLMAETCSMQPRSQNCEELKTKTGEYLYALGFNNTKEYEKIEKPNLNGDAKQSFDRTMMDWELYLVDRDTFRPENALNFYQRVWLFRFAAIVGLLSIVGSVGEAAFQLRQSILQARTKGA